MSVSIIIQYIIIALIALAIIAIVVFRLFSKGKNKGCNCGCQECALRSSCGNASSQKKKKSYSPIAKSRK